MPGLTCAYCGRQAEGNFSIHRDGFGVGPEVDLCDACGGEETPTTWDIWSKIAQPSTDAFAHRRAERVMERYQRMRAARG